MPCPYHLVSHSYSPVVSRLYHFLCPFCCFRLRFSHSLLVSSPISSLFHAFFSLPYSYFSRSYPLPSFRSSASSTFIHFNGIRLSVEVLLKWPNWPYIGGRRKSLLFSFCFSLVIFTFPSLSYLSVSVHGLKKLSIHRAEVLITLSSVKCACENLQLYKCLRSNAHTRGSGPIPFCYIAWAWHCWSVRCYSCALFTMMWPYRLTCSCDWFPASLRYSFVISFFKIRRPLGNFQPRLWRQKPDIFEANISIFSSHGCGDRSRTFKQRHDLSITLILDIFERTSEKWPGVFEETETRHFRQEVGKSPAAFVLTKASIWSQKMMFS